MLSYFFWLRHFSLAAMISSSAMTPADLSFIKKTSVSERLMNKADQLLLRTHARFNPDRAYPFYCYDRLTYLVTAKLLPQLCREHRFKHALNYVYQIIITLAEKGAYKDAEIIACESLKTLNGFHYSPLKIAAWASQIVVLLKGYHAKTVLAVPIGTAIERILITWLEEGVYYEKIEYASQLTQLLISHELGAYFPSKLISVLIARLCREGLMMQAVDICKMLIDSQKAAYPSWACELFCDHFELFKKALGGPVACEYGKSLMNSFFRQDKALSPSHAKTPDSFWVNEGARWYHHKKRYYDGLKNYYELQAEQLCYPAILSDSKSYQKIIKEVALLADKDHYCDMMTKKLLGRAMSVVMRLTHEMINEGKFAQAQQYYAEIYEQFHHVAQGQAELMKKYIGRVEFKQDELAQIKNQGLLWPPQHFTA